MSQLPGKPVRVDHNQPGIKPVYKGVIERTKPLQTGCFPKNKLKCFLKDQASGIIGLGVCAVADQKHLPFRLAQSFLDTGLRFTASPTIGTYTLLVAGVLSARLCKPLLVLGFSVIACLLFCLLVSVFELVILFLVHLVPSQSLPLKSQVFQII